MLRSRTLVASAAICDSALGFPGLLLVKYVPLAAPWTPGPRCWPNPRPFSCSWSAPGPHGPNSSLLGSADVVWLRAREAERSSPWVSAAATSRRPASTVDGSCGWCVAARVASRAGRPAAHRGGARSNSCGGWRQAAPPGPVPAAAWLAVGREQAVVSHRSALELWDLSDLIPDAALKGDGPEPGLPAEARCVRAASRASPGMSSARPR